MRLRSTLPSLAGVAVAAVVVVAGASFAHAQTAPLIRTGQEQYENLQYEEAIQTLSAAIIRRGNTPAQEVAIYQLLGLSYLALSRDEEAEGAFRLVLSRAPEHQLDASFAPRVREFFDRSRTRWVADGRPGVAQQNEPAREPRPVQLEHRSPAQQRRGQSLGLSTTIVDPDRRAASVVLAYRAGSRGLFHRLNTAREAGRFSATVPADEVRPPVVEYYFEALDPNGIPVASRGDAFAPMRVLVPQDTTPIYARWWFWAGAAAVVAGVAVGSYFIFSGGDSAPAQLTISVTGE